MDFEKVKCKKNRMNMQDKKHKSTGQGTLIRNTFVITRTSQ